MSKLRCVYAHVKEFPITARIGTRSEFIELAHKAMEVDPTLAVRCSDHNYWELLSGVKWTDIYPGSTIAYLIEKLESKYGDNRSRIRIMLTSIDAAFFITGTVPSYRYVCTKAEFRKLYDQVPAGTIELNILDGPECCIDMRKVSEALPEHPIVKEFMQCYAMSELTEASARANSHVLYFEFI